VRDLDLFAGEFTCNTLGVLFLGAEVAESGILVLKCHLFFKVGGSTQD